VEQKQKQNNQSFNPYCLACVTATIHNDEQWDNFHPLNRHGFRPELGWTLPELEPALAGQVLVNA
jgi:hypothetical protein